MNKFKQKFMIGLPLSAEVEEWKIFLSAYKSVIESVYFSVPLGRKYHSRLYIAKQFENVGMKEHFLNLIEAAMQMGLKLELVLNTESLTCQDIVSAHEFIVSNNIIVNSVSCLNCYYSYVRSVFKGQEINYSYNNFFNDISELENNRYNSIIIGRYSIRDTLLFKQLYDRNIKVILLLNNGCSHRCGWCHDLSHCKMSFDATKKEETVEFLYAEQSIMPFEINEGLLDVSHVYAFKINNRNSNLQYLKSCLDSYLLNDNELHNDVTRWELWGKLGWFSSYYQRFSLEKVIDEKRKIYDGKFRRYTQMKTDKMKEYSVVLNLCDEYSVYCGWDFNQIINSAYMEIYSKIGNYKLSIKEVRLGSETCCNLFRFIPKDKLIHQMCLLKEAGIEVSLVFPVVDESNYSLCCDLFLCSIENEAINNVVVNDYGMLLLCKEYQIKVILGRTFDKRLRDPRVQSDLFLNGNPEELGLFSDAYLKMYIREGISSLELECLELGIGNIIPELITTIYLHYPYRYITSGRICEFAGIGKENSKKFKINQCSMQCMKYIAKTQTSPIRNVIYKHCNAILEKIQLNNNLSKDFLNPKVRVIYTPEFTGRTE